ncbi:MAG: tRNA (5-methylaminomethyl-2-thiouridine)(34)-methyltransferase MnmD, partial [Pedobacter sp.]|nr:tRNA (5-methylaminomethyl-2-thiouridine)(34)-methyltransferase MnmD [Chitinophagaceae bacterium]
MKRSIQLTNDGSNTLAIPDLGVTYHSTSGAIGESLHVFIDAGLKHILTTENLKEITIFEMGFGTGLNALLTWQYAQKQQLKINYTSIELYPLTFEETAELNYGKQLQMTNEFTQLHQSKWEEAVVLDDNFTLHKTNQSLINFSTKQQYNLIYYDAFAPNDQPELWSKNIFEKLYNMLLPNGILVTYCSKGNVKRTLKTVGFTVERLQG